MPEIILVGGGGHCKSCIDVIETLGFYKIKGIIDMPEELGKTILGYQVIGNDDDLSNLASKKLNFLITLGHMGNPKRREELYRLIKSGGGLLPSISSPKAQVSKHARIDEGTIIMHNVVVNAGAEIGKNSILNTKVLIEHDVIIGDNCHISTGANINGSCTIDNNVFVGSSATLRNGISIASNITIGIGSVVIKNIDEKGVYYGNPLKKIR